MKKVNLLFTLLLIHNMVLIAQAPDWQWATQAGGSSADRGNGITIDDAGNSYVTGTFYGTATFGSYTITGNGGLDIFIAKMDAIGNWQWATHAGGSSWDLAYGITIDNAGNSYVTGKFEGTATFGSYSLTCNGGSYIFVAKMNANGNWQWAVKAGGISTDRGLGITIDDAGNSYATGFFCETAIFGSYSLTCSGERDIFIAEIDAHGNWLWASSAGGTSDDRGYGITIDNAGNSYVTGLFRETATFGSYSLTSSGSEDIFVAKMDANGNWLWATKAGGTSDDRGYGITIDDAGNSYVTGSFMSTATFGSYSLTSSGIEDIFVAMMDDSGNWLWTTKAGGTDEDCGNGITIDNAGICYVTGCFYQTATFGSYSLISSGGYDVFVAKMDVNGNWQWVTKAGGTYVDEGNGITIDNAGNCYVTGWFRDTATFGSYSLTSSGGRDIFVAKLNSPLSPLYAENEIIPTKIGFSNYPNPFNPSTTISFSMQNNRNVEISIYNIKGQKVKQLVSDIRQLPEGQHSVVWDGDDDKNKPVTSGIYFYKLEAGDFQEVRKMILMK